MKTLSLFSLIVLLFLFASCNSPYTHKKTGYFEIDLPEKAYQTFSEAGYPYTFEYPVYAEVVKDSTFFDSDNPYWININFPQFNGKIYISYKDIGGVSTYKIKGADGKYRDSTAKNDFYKMVNDAYNLSFKNDIKAYSIEDSVMHTPNGIGGVYFSLSGNVATAQQFFLSDTTKHFLRGALYFNVTPNQDSLMPVDNFLKSDMFHLINTLQWK
ncbi:MAG: hypothetical protein J5I50_10785 [Chitinophagaceae bacterium]|nr:hypothetical protein [Chitinophagaceae bacterium]